MQVIDWRQLIQEVQTYDRLKSEITTLSKRQKELEPIIPYMKSLIVISNSPQYLDISYTYMSSDSIIISDDNRTKLERDLAERKAELKVIQANLTVKYSERKQAYEHIIRDFLYKVMDDDEEWFCKDFYCPAELISAENLPFLKLILRIAYAKAPHMYGEGGYVSRGSVIADLSRKINAFEDTP